MPLAHRKSAINKLQTDYLRAESDQAVIYTHARHCNIRRYSKFPGKSFLGQNMHLNIAIDHTSTEQNEQKTFGIE